MATAQYSSEQVESLISTMNRYHLVGDAKRVWNGSQTVVIVRTCKNPPYKLEALLRDLHDKFGDKVDEAYPDKEVSVSYRKDDRLVVYRIGS